MSIYVMDGSKFEFFYGGPFSQWFHADFTVNGVTYVTAEQYMMAGKARTFGDNEVLEKILKSQHPSEQKRLGRQVRNFDVDKWNAVSRDIVYDGNYEKFSQNPGLKDILFETAGKLLVEGSPTDRLWGVGLDCFDEAIFDPANWRGTNWLGEVLTRVRDDMMQGIRTTENFGWSESTYLYDEPPPI